MIEGLLDWPTFVAHHWQQRPLRRQGDVDAVMRPEDLDVLLHFAYPAACAEGDLHLEDVHCRWPALAALCAELAERLSHPVTAGVYRTQGPSAAGCDSAADLLVLTVSGRRRYHIVPDIDADVCAGDILYIPRGHAWTAGEASEPTLHVVLRIKLLTVLDLLRALVDVHAETARPLREAVRLGDGDLDAALAARIPLLVEAPRLDEAVTRLGTRFVTAATVAPDGHFASLQTPIDADTLLRRRSPATVTVSDHVARINFAGNSVSGPARIGDTLRFISQQTTFRAADMPGLSGSAQILLARRLLLEGLLGLLP